MNRLGLIASLVACLWLAGCGGTTRRWELESSVDRQPVGERSIETTRRSGALEIRLQQRVRETTTQIKRLYLDVNRVESTVDWGSVGLTFVYVLGGIVLGALYIVIYALGHAWANDGNNP